MEQSTVLLVDDESGNISVMSSILKDCYKVKVCKSGAQALSMLTRYPLPDIILLDVIMPEMDGYAVLKKIRNEMKILNIPVLFVTSLNEDTDEEFGFSLGAADYLTKPIKPAVLKARIKAHLEVKQFRDNLQHQKDWLETEVQRRTKENQLIQDISLGVILELAETRDAETGNHIARTQAYVNALAEQLVNHPVFQRDLGGTKKFHIVKAAPLHDIGKVGIPDSILLKPGKLDPREWEIMKTHTTIGAQVIHKAIVRAAEAGISADTESVRHTDSLAILNIARVIAQSHHEKWDGTGYPDGLSGNFIPVPGRLMALADVYDALTTKRIYKEAWSLEEAGEYILSQQGNHFDPIVTEAFEAIQDQFRNIHHQMNDNSEPRVV